MTPSPGESVTGRTVPSTAAPCDDPQVKGRVIDSASASGQGTGGSMSGVRRVLGLTVAIIGALALSASAWASGGLPKLLSNATCQGSSCRPVYAVRPKLVVVADASGGNLEVVWSSWTGSAAVGSGTSAVAQMGTGSMNLINVRASHVVGGRFTRLAVTFLGSSHNQTEHLHLVGAGSSAPSWAP
jgi:hypothetical protein